MHAHRSVDDPITPATPPDPPPWAGRVQGLGVTDALRIELEPCQLPGLIDELEELRGVFEDALARASERRGAARQLTGSPPAAEEDEGEADVDRRGYELRVLAGIGAQLIGGRNGEEPVVVYGPSRLMAQIVLGAARATAEALSELLDGRPLPDAQARGRLVKTAAAARAWAETHAACQALEWFNFDRDCDPLGR